MSKAAEQWRALPEETRVATRGHLEMAADTWEKAARECGALMRDPEHLLALTTGVRCAITMLDEAEAGE
ncbi:MAG: hypothetical protein JOZ81_03200 [Chloroflexi bacterium]|nr:hypothetical protein [Chloroflexota bacterium]